MNKNTFVSDKRLYLDKNGNVVGEKDKNKLTLLVSKGGSLPFEEAEKYGLVKEPAGDVAEYEPTVREATEEEEAAEAGLQAKAAAKPKPKPKPEAKPTTKVKRK